MSYNSIIPPYMVFLRVDLSLRSVLIVCDIPMDSVSVHCFIQLSGTASHMPIGLQGSNVHKPSLSLPIVSIGMSVVKCIMVNFAFVKNMNVVELDV